VSDLSARPLPDVLFSRLAMDLEQLKKLGFTHILNATEGRKFGQINTSATYYEEAGIHYLGFPIIDTPAYKIGTHFEEAITFLEQALSNKKSKSSLK
jgi:dual specificity phosphatase 3